MKQVTFVSSVDGSKKNTDFLIQAWTTKNIHKCSKQPNLDVELLLEVAPFKCYISTVPYSSDPPLWQVGVRSALLNMHSFRDVVWPSNPV